MADTADAADAAAEGDTAAVEPLSTKHVVARHRLYPQLVASVIGTPFHTSSGKPMKGIRLALLLAAFTPLAARAQGPTYKNVLSIQPIDIVLTVIAGEYERAISKATTIGIGGTHWSTGDSGDKATYNSGDLKLRYYPGGEALHGFSFGGSIGFAAVSADDAFTSTTQTASGASFGVLLEYQWLLGAKKNFAVALGAGAKALSISASDISSSSFSAHYPTARISVGMAY